jgi:hypothetical protein
MNDMVLPAAWEYSKGHAVRRLQTNAADLRRLADKFDQLANDVDKGPTRTSPVLAETAAGAIHEHAVWLMNAQLHVAVTYAAEADRYRAEVEVAER